MDECARFELCEPPPFDAAHGRAAGRRVVVGAGEMVEAVGDIERQFKIGAAMPRAFFDGAFDVDGQIAGASVFAGDRRDAETDDVGRPVFSEIEAVELRDALMIGEQQRDLPPVGLRIVGFKFTGQVPAQSANRRQVEAVRCLMIAEVDFHPSFFRLIRPFSDRPRGREACW